MIRILIAVDLVIVREGLKRLVEAGGMEVVGEAASGREAVERAGGTRPEVVLLDHSIPGRGGCETVHELKRRDPRLRVLVLTAHAEDPFAVRCLRDGADGYLTLDVGREQLLEAIRTVYAGGRYVSQTIAERLAFSIDAASGRPPHEALSDRELQVLRRIGAGKSVGEIAAELGLSVKTISTFRSRLLEKMGRRNNAELARYVVEQGLL